MPFSHYRFHITLRRFSAIGVFRLSFFFRHIDYLRISIFADFEAAIAPPPFARFSFRSFTPEMMPFASDFHFRRCFPSAYVSFRLRLPFSCRLLSLIH
jgi:hypothetical protein